MRKSLVIDTCNSALWFMVKRQDNHELRVVAIAVLMVLALSCTVHADDPKDTIPTLDPTTALRNFMESTTCSEAEIKSIVGESFTIDNEPYFFTWSPNSRGWWATHTTYWTSSDEDDADYFTCFVVVYDTWANAYQDGGHRSLRRWVESSYDLAEYKVHHPPDIGHDFVASGFKHSSNVVESVGAAARYERGRVAVYLHADFTTQAKNVNPILANAAVNVALRDSTRKVLEMAVELDNRYKAATEETTTGKDYLAPRDLPKVNAGLR